MEVLGPGPGRPFALVLGCVHSLDRVDAQPVPHSPSSRRLHPWGLCLRKEITAHLLQPWKVHEAAM